MKSVAQYIWKDSFLRWLVIVTFTWGILCITISGGFIAHYYNVRLPREYAAWCKQTDNPKQLTFQEWKDYMSATAWRGYKSNHSCP